MIEENGSSLKLCQNIYLTLCRSQLHTEQEQQTTVTIQCLGKGTFPAHMMSC